MADAYLYDAEGHDKKVALSDDALKGLGEQQLVWIDLERADRKSVERAAALLKLPRLSLQSLLEPPASPRLDNFERHFQFSVPVAPSVGPASNRIDFVVSETVLLTVRDGQVEFFEKFREQDRGELLTGRLSPAALAASLLDWHLESYQADIGKILKAADKIDGDVLAERERRPPLAELAKLRRRVSELRDRLGEHRTAIHGVLRADFAHIADKPVAEYYAALERHFERAEDAIDRAREIVVGSFELYATRTAQDTNQLVKTLTLVTVVIGFVGAIAGIFGMNFETPIGKTGLAGFTITTVAMAVIAVAIVVVARLRKWM